MLTVYYVDGDLLTTVHVPSHRVLEDVVHAFNQEMDCQIPWKDAKFYLVSPAAFAATTAPSSLSVR